MKISGTLEPRDLVAAYWVSMRPRRSLAAVGILIILLCVLMLSVSVVKHRIDSHFWGVAAALAYFILVYAVWGPYRLHRHYQQRKDLQRTLSIGIEEDVLSWENETGIVRKPWNDYLKWKEGKNVFLIYTSDGSFQVIPKRFLSGESEAAKVREMIKKKIERHEA